MDRSLETPHAPSVAGADPRVLRAGVRRCEVQPMKFRKKPVVIEAFQMTESRRWDNSEWPHWLNEAWNKPSTESGALFIRPMDNPNNSLLGIATMEGPHAVNWDDWIIRGIKGELYPCKPDIFEATYEAVE